MRDRLGKPKAPTPRRLTRQDIRRPPPWQGNRSWHDPARPAEASGEVPRNQGRIFEALQDDEVFAVRLDGSMEDHLAGIREMDVKITLPDQPVFNGMVHGINLVIVPPSVVRGLRTWALARSFQEGARVRASKDRENGFGPEGVRFLTPGHLGTSPPR